MGEDGSLAIETARACPGLFAREGVAFGGALVNEEDGVI